ncbi:GDSL-type esterase/lipase family protein [Novosphingobium sp.]|uniref:GDSL-type esterase/lipase family protein n=1 Tax=Novosphingobium sp. TaxID=1874826 RepID=UPI00286D7245|nr:GDSL-type esterase/lipase family protein [Novosphingobium sp.]
MTGRAVHIARRTGRVALYLLALVGVAHFATIWLRPAVRGMNPAACEQTGSGSLHLAGLWIRYLSGDTPVFDNWTGACAFAGQNAEALQSGQTVDIVFIGDSITQHWLAADPALFGKTRLNRGIPGHSAAQVLTRFPSDVVELRPRIVHLLAGTNDVLGVHGPATPAIWQGTMRAIVDLAKSNGITVILGTMPPMLKNPFDPHHLPAAVIAEQNRWLRALAQEKGLILADYHAVLASADGGFKSGLSDDGTHPTAAGYAAMRPLLDKALAEANALSKK